MVNSGTITVKNPGTVSCTAGGTTVPMEVEVD